MAKKALLMILDGWGIGKHGKGDVIYNTPTQYLDYLTAVSAHSQLLACGEDVGLPEGQMGNSEVGHLNIGAGRIVYQDLVKINRACKDGSILQNKEIVKAYSYAKENGKKLHLMGLTSTGGVHSSLNHLFKFIEIGKEYGLNDVYVHCFMDGRDTDPKSGKGFIEQVQECCDKNGAHIASIVGRFEEAGMHTIKGLQYFCMTPYDASFTGVNILFPKENVTNTLGEYLSAQGKRQLHTAETEKYAHVTFFFNGGRETPYEGEDRILVPSPKVATYDLKPEMSAYEVKDKLVGAINTQEYDFIVVNFANGDMVGHTGIYNAIAKAVHAIDNCVKDVVETAKANDYEVIIIADHGNADNAINEDETPNTAHSLNPVPFIYVTNNNSATVKDGRLADVAPSILHIMGLEKPEEMTGENLICD